MISDNMSFRLHPPGVIFPKAKMASVVDCQVEFFHVGA